MSGLPISLQLDDQVLDELAARVAALLADQNDIDPWLTVAEAADYMRCKPQRVYDLVSQARLTPGRDGSRLIFRRSTLDAYLENGGRS